MGVAMTDDTPGEPLDPTDPPEADVPPGTARLSRGRLAALVALVVIGLVAAGALVLRSGDSSDADPTTTTTTTTTTVEVREDTVVATARNPTVDVLSSPPPGWDTATPVEVFDAEIPEASQATVPARDPLPRLDYPVQGRYATATGWTFSNPTSLGDPFVMMVTERRGDWLKVQVPVRPNGTEGWVSAADVTLSDHGQRIELRLGERVLRFYDGGDLVLETPVVIGKEETRTPTGRFYVTDTVSQSNPAGAFGPLAIATSAYSEQLDIFDDGVPVIALHGTNQPELMGQAVSNGCVRMPNDVVTKLGAQVQLGTPVDIFA
jgi:hypothetical protein